MPTKERLKVNYIDQFLCSRRDNSNLPPKTISKYRAVITQAVDALDEAGLNCYPKKIGEKEINYLRKNHFVKNSQRYNRWKLSIFSGWLAWYHNDTLEKMRIPWPQDARINPEFPPFTHN